MRTVGSKGDVTRENLKEAAIDLFAEYGFKAVTLRMIADRVGIQAGSLYNYMDNKHDLLVEILTDIMSELLQEFDDNIPSAGDPIERMLKFIRFHIFWHTTRKKMVFIGNMELRSLDQEGFKKVVDLRDTYQRNVEKIIDEGVSAGVFHVSDSKVASSALIAMLTGVSSWYKEGGRLTQKKLIEYHIEMAFGLLATSEGVLEKYTRYVDGDLHI